MNKKQILVVGDPATRDGYLYQWANNLETFESVFVHTDEKAIEISHQRGFDLVVIDSTSTVIDYKKLSAILPILHAEIELINYKGESTDELEKRIRTIFERKRVQRMKQLLILDATGTDAWSNLPPFSAN